MGTGPSIFEVLYCMAVKAPRTPRAVFLDRLTTGIANHYGAVACAIHTDGSGWASGAAEPESDLAELSRIDRARLETLEARLVEVAVERGAMSSLLDLEGQVGDHDSADEFLVDRLGVVDVFAFPMAREASTSEVLVLYLGEESRHLKDPDMYALSSLGWLVVLAGEALDAASQEPVPPQLTITTRRGTSRKTAGRPGARGQSAPRRA